MADVAMQTLETVWLVVKYGWWLGIVLWLAILKMMYKNYPIEAVIIEKRGDNHIKTNDRVGKYVDKLTGLVMYRFMKTKDNIPVVDFEWILHNNKQDLGIFDKINSKLFGNAGTAFFYKYGSRQYKPVKVSEDPNTKVEWQEVKDKKGNPLTISVIKPINPRDKMAGLNFEVVDWDNMNFMVQEQRASIERRKKASEIWKQILLPAIIIGGAVVVTVIMMKFGYDFALEMKNSASPVAPPKNATNPNIPIIGDLMPK